MRLGGGVLVPKQLNIRFKWLEISVWFNRLRVFFRKKLYKCDDRPSSTTTHNGDEDDNRQRNDLKKKKFFRSYFGGG